MKKILYSIFCLTFIFSGCSSQASAKSLNKNNVIPSDMGRPGGFAGPGQNIEIIDDGSTTNYVDQSSAEANAVISEDLYENFKEDGTVTITFNGKSYTSSFTGLANKDEISIKDLENSAEDETAAGVEIQYKGKAKIKYILKGNYTGTVFIKNKKADAAVVLENVNLTSDQGSGPVLRFSAEETRTFIVIPAGTSSTLTDTRLLNQSATMYDDKKGSIYAKGTLIFTGESSTSQGGSLNVVNSGYKHAIYSKDYIRIANLTMNVSVEGESGRDCIRALNAIIVDGGDINLIGKGTITDDESAGLRVDGEDADEDDMTVEYTAGAGFIIINGGNITIDTIAKGITAHWKSDKSEIGNSSYSQIANKSLLTTNFLKNSSQSLPNPYVEINGGSINITTRGEPYEGRTDDDPSCSPEGIEAKANLTINAGTITLKTTDDSINAGGNIVINGGAIYACSSQNDALDANGKNGITINGGVIVAIGGNGAECAFDCDNAPLTINGGYIIGLGGGNYTAPKSGKQSVLVLSSSSTGSANSSFAVVDSKNKPVFVYTMPANSEVIILSSPDIKTDTSYSVKTGITVKENSGIRFHNLYTSLPSISGGSESLTNISTSASNTVYTDSNAGRSGFRGGFGGNRNAGGKNEDFTNRSAGNRGQRPDLPQDFNRPDENMRGSFNKKR